MTLLVIHPPVFAQEAKVMFLEHADSLWVHVIEGEEVRELIGKVVIRQENVRITCDRALQFIRKDLVLLQGNMVVRDDSVTLTAPRGSYHRDERRAEAFDDVRLDDGKTVLTARYGEYFIDQKKAFFSTDVVLRDSSSTVTADSLTYFRAERRGIALGRVTVFNESDNVTIMGGRLDHDAPRLFSRMTVSPVLVQSEASSSGRTDTLVVRSRVMESYRDSTRRLVAIDSVEVVQGELAGTAAYAVFYTKGDSIVLRQTPVLWYQQTQLSGDSIDVLLKARKLSRINVMGSAFAISQGDSLRPDRFDQLAGEMLRMDFANQQLERVEVETHAISVYHLYEDSVANGLNRTSGDRIVMSFEAGKLRSIRVLDGVEGEYFPENMVNRRESEYAIAGFTWRQNRPTLGRLRPARLPMNPSWKNRTDSRK
jgi:lipopolysaccharide export system protein LptA